MMVDRNEVHDIAARLEAAFNASDAVALASLYSDAAILMPPNEPMVRGRTEIQAWFERALIRLRSVRIVPTESTAEGDHAFQVGTFTTTVPSSGEEGIPLAGKYVLVLKNLGGQWKIQYDIWSLDQPTGSATL
jgi:ketosteroid isomerase-like protein